MPAGSWIVGECFIRGQRLAYARTGGDRPPVVLLHGFTEDSSTWFELARALEHDYELIMPDMIGHGNSDRLSSDVQIDLRQDLANLFAALQLPKAALLGHSLGALTTAQFAAERPELTALVILEDIPWFDPAALPVIPQDSYSAANPTVIKRLSAGNLSQAQAYCTEHFPRWNESARKAWSESKLRFDTKWFLQPLQNQPEWRDTAANFTFPSMLISGDNRLGSLISPGFALQALKTIPDLQWCRIPGAGHYLHYDAPEAFISSVKTYLRMHYPPKKG